jgi:hypothetical protein
MSHHGDTGAPDPGDKHVLLQLGNRFGQILYFSLRLISHPIITVFSRLEIASDEERITEAVYFLGAMISLWFVIEIPMFIHRGIRAATPSGSLFFVCQVIIYLLLASVYGGVLHILLRAFGVRSTLVHTAPCFFYTGIEIPPYAFLIYPMYLVKYWVIDKAGTVAILLDRAKYGQIQDEILQRLGRNWQIGLCVSNILVNAWAVVVFIFLSIVISKWYRARYWRCAVATLVLFVFISVFERFLLEPASEMIEVLFARS